MNLKSSLGQLARGVLFACLVALSTNALSIVEDEDPFEPYLESIPTILDTISLENTIHSSVSIIVEKFTFSSRSDSSTVFAIMAYPESGDIMPGILLLHGGGSNAGGTLGHAKNYASRGYVAMCIDLPGLCGNDKTPYSSGPWKSKPNGEGPRFDVSNGVENSTLVDAEIAAIEACNLLSTMKNVDTTRMGVAGFSWGGYSTTMVAGLLGNKVKAAYAVFGCGYFEKGSFWKNTISNMSEADRNTWLTYLDAGRRAPSITAPYFLEAASNDTYFWPEAVEHTLDAIPGFRNHTWGPNKNHRRLSAGISMMQYHFDYYLKSKGQPFGRVSVADSSKISGISGDGMIYINLQMPQGINVSSVKLYYSSASGLWQQRSWEPIEASSVSDTVYSASIPVSKIGNGVDYYIYVTDSRGITVSSMMHNSTSLPLALYNLSGSLIGKWNCTSYEESSHIPLIMRFPGSIDEDVQVDGYVSLVDLFPTILDYMGVEEHASDGKSLRGLIEGTDEELRTSLPEWLQKNNSEHYDGVRDRVLI